MYSAPYFITENCHEFIEKLDAMYEERRTNNALWKYIDTMTQDEAVVQDIWNYLHRRALVDANKGTLYGQSCCIQRKLLGFLKWLSGEESPIEDEGEFELAAGCNHEITEEDMQMAYLKEYQRFLVFRQWLKDMLED